MEEHLSTVETLLSKVAASIKFISEEEVPVLEGVRAELQLVEDLQELTYLRNVTPVGIIGDRMQVQPVDPTGDAATFGKSPGVHPRPSTIS